MNNREKSQRSKKLDIPCKIEYQVKVQEKLFHKIKNKLKIFKQNKLHCQKEVSSSLNSITNKFIIKIRL